MIIRNLIAKAILTQNGYSAPEITDAIKLDANENPFTLQEPLKRRLADTLRSIDFNRYPAAGAPDLRERFADYYGVKKNMIMPGNGSDELIQILAMALARPGATLLAVEPSFVMYRMIAGFAGMRYVGVPLQADFSLDEAAVLEAVEREEPALTFLAYPNNPTGNAFDRAAVERIVAASPGLVVVDEAYHAFAGGLSFLDALARFDNLLLMRTVSKLGLAGLRLGYLVGKPAWIGEFDKVRLPYNVNVLTQVAARYALSHVDVLEAQAATLVGERGRLFQALSALSGVEVFESRANFILFRVPDAPGVFAGLKARGVLIKNLHGGHPLLNHCLRVTVGAPEENEAFLTALAAELEH